MLVHEHKDTSLKDGDTQLMHTAPARTPEDDKSELLEFRRRETLFFVEGGPECCVARPCDDPSRVIHALDGSWVYRGSL